MIKITLRYKTEGRGFNYWRDNFFLFK